MDDRQGAFFFGSKTENIINKTTKRPKTDKITLIGASFALLFGSSSSVCDGDEDEFVDDDGRLRALSLLFLGSIVSSR